MKYRFHDKCYQFGNDFSLRIPYHYFLMKIVLFDGQTSIFVITLSDQITWFNV